jgi:hypothetical protein
VRVAPILPFPGSKVVCNVRAALSRAIRHAERDDLEQNTKCSWSIIPRLLPFDDKERPERPRSTVEKPLPLPDFELPRNLADISFSREAKGSRPPWHESIDGEEP